jgi:putative restriction endonuclease
LRDALRRDPQLVALIAQRIADAHFPESIRNDVLAAAGFPSELSAAAPAGAAARRRDPAFREKVLLAYQYRCGVCGHDLRLGSQTIGLEAAHIKWFQAQGPGHRAQRPRALLAAPQDLRPGGVRDPARKPIRWFSAST